MRGKFAFRDIYSERKPLAARFSLKKNYGTKKTHERNSPLTHAFFSDTIVALSFRRATSGTDWILMYVISIAARHLKTRSISWVAVVLIAVIVLLYLLIISVLEGFK